MCPIIERSTPQEFATLGATSTSAKNIKSSINSFSVSSYNACSLITLASQCPDVIQSMARCVEFATLGATSTAKNITTSGGGGGGGGGGGTSWYPLFREHTYRSDDIVHSKGIDKALYVESIERHIILSKCILL